MKWSRSVVSDSLRPHRRQPTRLPRPWDSPGKNTGVGCHFLLHRIDIDALKIFENSLSFLRIYIYIFKESKMKILVTQSYQTLCNPMDCSPPGSSVQARIVEWVAFSFSGDLPSPGIKPGSPALHADFMYLFTFYRLSYWESQNEKWTWKSLSRVWLFPTPRTATTIHGLLQARILEWAAFPFSRGSSQPRAQTQVSHVAGRFFTTELWGKRGEDKSSLNLEPDYSKYSPDPWPQSHLGVC